MHILNLCSVAAAVVVVRQMRALAVVAAAWEDCLMAEEAAVGVRLIEVMAAAEEH